MNAAGLLRRRFVIFLVVGPLALGGCVSVYSKGQIALRSERYEEASQLFVAELGRHPDRVEAMVGYGIAEYKRGNFEVAAKALRHAIDEAPGGIEARLYLGLAYLGTGADDTAREQLATLRGYGAHPELVAQIDRALEVLEAWPSVHVREFVRTSLEREYEWALAVARARRVPRELLEPSWIIRWDGAGSPRPIPTR